MVLTNDDVGTDDAEANGREFSSGGAGARNSHQAPMQTTRIDPAVANARAGPYHSTAVFKRSRR